MRDPAGLVRGDKGILDRVEDEEDEEEEEEEEEKERRLGGCWDRG